MRDDVEGLDSAILMHPSVWEACGHVAGFVDPMVDCRNCKGRFRADKLTRRTLPAEPEQVTRRGGTKVTLTEPRQFNLMFKTFMGRARGGAATMSTCVRRRRRGLTSTSSTSSSRTRQKVPFGIAQIGKAFRNEITPGNFIFRTREFEQMEMQFFVEPTATDMEWFEYWKAERMRWHRGLGLSRGQASVSRAYGPGELAHYARAAFDVQFDFGGSLGVPGNRRHPQPRRLRPVAAPEVLGQEARILRAGDQQAVPAVRRRDGGRARTACCSRCS